MSNLENGNESWWGNSLDVITSLEYKNMCIFRTCFESIVKAAQFVSRIQWNAIIRMDNTNTYEC